MASSYLTNAPEDAGFLHCRNTREIRSLTNYAGLSSSDRGWRAVVAHFDLVFDGRRLGKWFDKLRPPIKTMTIFGGMMVGSADLPHLQNVMRSPRSMLYAAKMATRHARDRLTYSRGTRLTNGNALIASLAMSALERNIPIWLSANVEASEDNGWSRTGAVVERDGNLRLSSPDEE